MYKLFNVNSDDETLQSYKVTKLQYVYSKRDNMQVLQPPRAHFNIIISMLTLCRCVFLSLCVSLSQLTLCRFFQRRS